MLLFLPCLCLRVKTITCWSSVIGVFGVVSFLKVSLCYSSSAVQLLLDHGGAFVRQLALLVVLYILLSGVVVALVVSQLLVLLSC